MPTRSTRRAPIRDLMLRAIGYYDADRQMIATGLAGMQFGGVIGPYGDPRLVGATLD